jgi:hypothetical protein
MVSYSRHCPVKKLNNYPGIKQIPESTAIRVFGIPAALTDSGIS